MNTLVHIARALFKQLLWTPGVALVCLGMGLLFLSLIGFVLVWAGGALITLGNRANGETLLPRHDRSEERAIFVAEPAEKVRLLLVETK